MPAHHFCARGGVVRHAPLMPATNEQRAELLALLADLGPILLVVSQAADECPSGAAGALLEARARIDRALSSLL